VLPHDTTESRIITNKPSNRCFLTKLQTLVEQLAAAVPLLIPSHLTLRILHNIPAPQTTYWFWQLANLYIWKCSFSPEDYAVRLLLGSLSLLNDTLYGDEEHDWREENGRSGKGLPDLKICDLLITSTSFLYSKGKVWAEHKKIYWSAIVYTSHIRHICYDPKTAL